MKNLTPLFRHRAENQPAATFSTNRLSLTRTFVETGDERCPLAGIWSRLPELDAATDDDPGLLWPALGTLFSRLLPGRALHLQLTRI